MDSEASSTTSESKQPSKKSNITTKRREEPLPKCATCKTRLARRGCTQLACLSCCEDLQCEGHREARHNAQWKEDVLNGNTDIQKRATKKRGSTVLPGSFRECGFVYLNQTITIWDRKKFLKNRKWKEDAVRRSEKRKARDLHWTKPVAGSSHKRFRFIMDDLYLKSKEATDA